MYGSRSQNKPIHAVLASVLFSLLFFIPQSAAKAKNLSSSTQSFAYQVMDTRIHMLPIFDKETPSFLSLQNISLTQTTYSIRFYAINGVLTHEMEGTIAGGATERIFLNNISALPSSYAGFALVVSTQDLYSPLGITAGGTQWKFEATKSIPAKRYLVTNVGTASDQINIRFYSTTNTLVHTLSISLAPGASYVFSMADITELPNDFVGMVDIQSQDVSIAAVAPQLILFIPGIMGSNLRIEGEDTDIWPGGLLTDHRRMSLRPHEANSMIATDATRRFGLGGIGGLTYPVIVYEPLLQMLQQTGYKEYNVNNDPNRRTETGCDLSQKDQNPTLFVFAYDWRKSVADAASQLKGYIRCIQQFYPGYEINIIAHSMGGLVARRYALNALKNGEQHYIDIQITIGTPWLGAPRAIGILQTGEYGEVNVLVLPSTLRTIAEYFPGAQELLPSERYFQRNGSAFIENGWDVDGNKNTSEPYDYAKWTRIANQIYPQGHACEAPSLCRAGSNNQQFHTFAGQDDWQNIFSEIEYHYIVGIQSKEATVKSLTAEKIPLCHPSSSCIVVEGLIPHYGLGDGTVPVISAQRGLADSTTDGDVITIHPMTPEQGWFGAKDGDVDHVKLTHNPQVHLKILNILKTQGEVMATQINRATLSAEPAYYVKAYGGGSAQVVNVTGQVTGILSDTYRVYGATEVAYHTIGENAFSVVIPTSGAYTLTFKSEDTPFFVEIRKGTGDAISEAIRYQDVSIPPTSTVMLVLDSANVLPLLYDDTGDGFADTPITPTVVLSGAVAADIQPPVISIVTATVGSLVRVTVNAHDSSGVAQVYYSFDSMSYKTYTDPIVVDARQPQAMYVFADDSAGNRSSIVTATLLGTTTESSLYLPLVIR